MSDPLSNIERMVSDWERNAEENAARYQNMQQEVERISITESAADGAVSVTVGANGIPANVEMTDRVSRLRPDEIAAADMQAMTKAQFLYGNPSRGYFDHAVFSPPASRFSEFTAEAIGPGYQLSEEVVEENGQPRVERVFVQVPDAE